MNGYYELVVKALREQGFFLVLGGKGSHEKWSNGRHVAIVPFNCNSRHTANAILRDAGISKRF